MGRQTLIVLREGLDLTAVPAGSLSGGETQRAMARGYNIKTGLALRTAVV